MSMFYVFISGVCQHLSQTPCRALTRKVLARLTKPKIPFTISFSLYIFPNSCFSAMLHIRLQLRALAQVCQLAVSAYRFMQESVTESQRSVTATLDGTATPTPWCLRHSWSERSLSSNAENNSSSNTMTIKCEKLLTQMIDSMFSQLCLMRAALPDGCCYSPTACS